jgi:hypothetical protein
MLRDLKRGFLFRSSHTKWKTGRTSLQIVCSSVWYCRPPLLAIVKAESLRKGNFCIAFQIRATRGDTKIKIAHKVRLDRAALLANHRGKPQFRPYASQRLAASVRGTSFCKGCNSQGSFLFSQTCSFQHSLSSVKLSRTRRP